MGVTYGEDKNTTFQKDGFLSGLYYYYLDKSKLINENLTIPFQLSTIQTLSFLPFFNEDDLQLTKCNLDYDYFKVNRNISNITVNRLEVESIKKELPHYSFREDFDKIISDKNEPIELMYPYRYFLLSDGINPPLLIKPNHYRSFTLIPVVESYITQGSKYKIYISNNPNDNNGQLESIVNNTSFLLPIGNNAYNNFLMTSGNTYQATNSLAYLENDKNLSQSMDSLNLSNQLNGINNLASGLNGVASLFMGNIFGGVSQIASSGLNYYTTMQQNKLIGQQNQENYNFKNYQIDTMNMARKKDYLNTPRTMKTLGNDAMFNLNNTKGKLMLYDYGLSPFKINQINQYYKRYGYKIEEYNIPNITNKKYWNFIKTQNCNIDGELIPYEDIEGIQQIFDSGITFWHIENGAKVGDYSQYNSDVE